MATIPKDLSKLNLDTTVLNFKYTTNHIQMIEEASQMDRSRKLPGHILFEEWGTSGRVRPTLANLLQLLVQASLFRAADYLADILHGKFSNPIIFIFPFWLNFIGGLISN